MTPKDRLHRTLQVGRAAVLAKVDGVPEIDARRPLTPTATNLLGLVKHLAWWESRYLGHVMGRPCAEPIPPWDDEEARGADTWVTAEESRDDVLGLFARVTAHSDDTIAALSLDAPGHVPWWPSPEVRLSDVLVHLVAETHRHAGHVDVLREQLDGVIGASADHLTRVADDETWWAERWATVDAASRARAVE